MIFKRVQLNGQVAVVTGAASGIGRALAVTLAGEGCSLAIADIDESGLHETAQLLQNRQVRITTHRLDVASRNQMQQFADDVIREHGKVNLVINNAGVGLDGRLDSVAFEDLEWLLGINLWGVIYGSRAFLPCLKQQSQAHIVNISSVHGLFTQPGVGPYCTSKFAVRGFTQALQQELADTSVRVSCVFPGGIRTSIARNCRMPDSDDEKRDQEYNQQQFDRYVARTSAERAARIIVDGIKRRKKRILVGYDAHISALLARLFPNTWQWIMQVVS